MNEKSILDNQAWDESTSGYPEPTVITVDENTDFTKMHERVIEASSNKVRRVMIGIKVFSGEMCEDDFQKWQKEEPREIFEITPTAVLRDGHITPIPVVFVTYSAGVIE